MFTQVLGPGRHPYIFFETFLGGKVSKMIELFLRMREMCSISQKKSQGIPLLDLEEPIGSTGSFQLANVCNLARKLI